MASLPEPTLPQPERWYVEECLEYSRQYTAAWRQRTEIEYAAFAQNLAPLVVVDGFDPVGPASYYTRVSNAAIQLLPAETGVQITVEPPVRKGADEPTKLAKERADYTEGIVAGALKLAERNARQQVALGAALHRFVSGWAVLFGAYDASFRLPKPRGLRAGSEEYDEWEAKAALQFPYLFETRHPLNCYPSPGDDGRTWLIYRLADLTQGEIAARFPTWRPRDADAEGRWRTRRCTWIEYRDAEWVYQGLEGEEPIRVAPHFGTAGTGYTVFGGGGLPDGSFADRYVGLCTRAREAGLFALEQTLWTSLAAVATHAAFPMGIADPRVTPGQWAPGVMNTIVGLRDNENLNNLVVWYRPPTPPAELFTMIERIAAKISEATLAEVVGSGTTTTDTAATLLTQLQEGKTKLSPVRMELQDAYAQRAEALVADLRNKRYFGKGDYFVIGRGKDGAKGQEQLPFRRDDLMQFPIIRCHIDPITPAEKAVNFQTGNALFGKVSDLTVFEKYWAIPNPEEEYVQREAEGLVKQVLLNPQALAGSPIPQYMQAMTTRGRGAFVPYDQWLEQQQQQQQQQYAAAGATNGASGQGVPPGEQPPKTSINFKDLPPEGQVQLAAQAGITLPAGAALGSGAPSPGPSQPPGPGGFSPSPRPPVAPSPVAMQALRGQPDGLGGPEVPGIGAYTLPPQLDVANAGPLAQALTQQQAALPSMQAKPPVMPPAGLPRVPEVPGS